MRQPGLLLPALLYSALAAPGCMDEALQDQAVQDNDIEVTTSSLLNVNNEYLPLAARANWTGSAYTGNHGNWLVDVTGDKKADIIASRDNGLFVRRSTGTRFNTTSETWSSIGFWGGRGTYFADVTGDGKADAIASWDNGTFVRRSTGSSFNATNETWTSDAFWGSRGTYFADVDGDGKADAIVATETSVEVRLSTGNGFSTTTQTWSTVGFWGYNGLPYFADVTGDGRADAIAIWPEGAWVRRAAGGTFGPNEQWSFDNFRGGMATFFADADGDGASDIIAVNSDGVWIRRSNRFQFGSNELWADQTYLGGTAFAADVNGDSRADIIEVTSTGAQVTPSRFRNIRLSVVQFINGPTGPKASTTQINNTIATANKVYAPAGIKFNMQNYYEVTSAALANSSTDAVSTTELAKAKPFNTACTIGSVTGLGKDAQLEVVATRCGPSNHIVVYIYDRPGGGSWASYPQQGNVVRMARNNITDLNATNMLLGHELGHYLGLLHVWEIGIQDPQTQTNSYTVFWDLVYYKNGSTPLSFKSRAEAAQYESNLTAIDYKDPTPGWRCPSGNSAWWCPLFAPVGMIVIPVLDAYGNSRHYTSGEEFLKGLGLRQPNGTWTFNVMSYNYPPDDSNYNQVTPAISLSQIEQIKRVLTFETTTGIKSNSGAYISARRTLLGR